MSDSLAPGDPTTTRFEATVEAVDGREVTLEKTYFYPESGGQPADHGTLGGVAVEHVRDGEDGVVHLLADDPSFAAGDVVVGDVDDAFRTYCTRAHTASHVLYGAARRLYDELGYGGFDIAPEKVRVDLRTDGAVDDDALVEMERLANRAVWESRDVTWRTLPADEARELPGIAFNTRTEESAMAGAGEVRVVEVDDWDLAACGGTHVRNTCEIGPITVLERSNPGEGLTRVEFAVGPTAIERRAAESGAVRAAAAAADSAVTDLPDAVARLRADLDDARSEREALRGDLVATRLDALAADTVERAGGEWLVGVVDGAGPNDLSDHAARRAGEDADVVALTGRDGATFVVVGAADGFDAGGVVDAVTDEFGGGGGGGPDGAQGGGIDADPGTVAAFLRED
jgi:alanyl-tRNA synthetase